MKVPKKEPEIIKSNEFELGSSIIDILQSLEKSSLGGSLGRLVTTKESLIDATMPNYTCNFKKVPHKIFIEKFKFFFVQLP